MVPVIEFEIIIIPNSEGGFYAKIPDIPSIFTGGITEEEAVRKAKQAIKEYVKICKEDGLKVPEPKSGRFNLRIPKELHRDLVRKAEEEGVSLNQYVTHLLSSATG